MVIVTHGAYRQHATSFQEPTIRTRMVVRLTDAIVSPRITWREEIMEVELEGVLH